MVMLSMLKSLTWQPCWKQRGVASSLENQKLFVNGCTFVRCKYETGECVQYTVVRTVNNRLTLRRKATGVHMLAPIRQQFCDRISGGVDEYSTDTPSTVLRSNKQFKHYTSTCNVELSLCSTISNPNLVSM